MPPEILRDSLTAEGNEVVLPSAASFGGFVQVRSVPVPTTGFGCVLAGDVSAAAVSPLTEAHHAR